jgi:regulator of protease activity HflC (stomatin/prohibitin superfamily)
LLQEPDTGVGTHYSIHRHVEETAKKGLAERDIELVNVQIGRFQFPEEIEKQLTMLWKAGEERLAASRSAEEALASVDTERKRSLAELEMDRQIADAIRAAGGENQRRAMQTYLSLQLIEVLETVVRDAQDSVDGSIDLLLKLRGIQRRLQG